MGFQGWPRLGAMALSMVSANKVDDSASCLSLEKPRRSLAFPLSPLMLIDGLSRKSNVSYDKLPEEPLKLSVIKLDGSSFGNLSRFSSFTPADFAWHISITLFGCWEKVLGKCKTFLSSATKRGLSWFSYYIKCQMKWGLYRYRCSSCKNSHCCGT